MSNWFDATKKNIQENAKDIEAAAYYDKLIDIVKLAGKEISEKADKIVAKVPHISDFEIVIRVEQGEWFMSSYPEISVRQSFFPNDTDKIRRILEGEKVDI